MAAAIAGSIHFVQEVVLATGSSHARDLPEKQSARVQAMPVDTVLVTRRIESNSIEGSVMPDTLPKIWGSYFNMETENVFSIDYHTDRPRIDYINEKDAHVPVERLHVPDYIYFSVKVPDSRKSGLPDWFMIIGGIFVISQKFHDLLARFELGETRMFEVPLYDSDQKTIRLGRWFILHVAAKKVTVIPELSEGIAPSGQNSPRWKRRLGAMSDTLAVRADSASGADLWVDPLFRNRLFLSDRLLTAMRVEEIKVRELGLSECTVTTEHS